MTTLVGALGQVADDAGLSLTLEATITEPLAPAVELAAYRIGTEALLNVARHAGTGEARIALDCIGGNLVLWVRDGGRGRGDTPAGVGTLAMRERAEELGGSVSVGRPSAGAGTVVEARIPVGLPARRPEAAP